jgi:ribosome-associated protein
MSRKPHRDPEVDPPVEYDGPSKSQVKRDFHALQDLGLELLELSDATLAALIDDERLLGALRELRRVRDQRGARKRQVQYVGKLLRDEDITPLRAALAARRAPGSRPAPKPR